MLASFTDVLLLPVTIVPRTVGKAVNAAFTQGSSAAVQGIAMLNPQRWGASTSTAHDGYVQDFNKGTDGTLFEIGGDEDDEEDEPKIEPTRRGYLTFYVYCRLLITLQQRRYPTRRPTPSHRATTPGVNVHPPPPPQLPPAQQPLQTP